MLFNSFEFILGFLPVALVGWFVLARRSRSGAIAWLVVASLFFYGWWQPVYLLLLGFALVFNYAVAAGLARWRSGWLLAFGIAVDLGLLAYFKYANFFVQDLQAATGIGFDWTPVILPLAISFFTFQEIAYLVDVHDGKAKTYGFMRYALFVTFFPHLLAGPIVRHDELLPQFDGEAPFRFSRDNLAAGGTLFAIGLFKKVVVADTLATFADPVFAGAQAGAAITFFEAWVGALAFTFQLYYDFSGYTDMAIGLARMFGVRLPMNFNSPYKAVSFIDFWHRMHITLSRWLRDYLYLRLGGGRQGLARQGVNLMITMGLGGLWHGAGWTYIVFGLVQGALLVINHAWRSLRRAMGHDLKRRTAWGTWAARALTFFVFAVSLVVFRAPTLEAAGAMYAGMAGRNGVVLFETYYAHLGGLAPVLADWGVRFERLFYWQSADSVVIIAALLAIAWFAPNSQEIMARDRPALDFEPRSNRDGWRFAWAPTAAWGAATGVVLFVAMQALFAVPPSAFIYFQY